MIMPEEPFLMLSLKDDQAKKLANVLTNKSASQILNYLATHDGVTETEIAKSLKLPLSTVNYNMKAMVEAKLVIADEYHYSTRGKEVNHYRLARKYIIIAPEDDRQGFWDRVKKYVPITLVALGTAAIARILTLAGKSAGAAAQFAAPMADVANDAAPEAARMVTDEAVGYGAEGGAMLAAKSAEMAPPVMEPVIEQAPSVLSTVFGDWFGWLLLGLFLFLLAALVVEYLIWKRK
jgi:DNA-binding transcriptional ArsR family regulator